MIVENVQNLTTRQPSKEFYDLVESFAQSFEKPKEIYKKIVELGRKENFSDFEIDLLISSYLKGRIAKQTLLNYKKEFLNLEEKPIEKTFDDKKVIEDSSSQTVQIVRNEDKKVIEDDSSDFVKMFNAEADQVSKKEEPKTKKYKLTGFVAGYSLTFYIEGSNIKVRPEQPRTSYNLVEEE